MHLPLPKRIKNIFIVDNIEDLKLPKTNVIENNILSLVFSFKKVTNLDLPTLILEKILKYYYEDSSIFDFKIQLDKYDSIEYSNQTKILKYIRISNFISDIEYNHHSKSYYNVNHKFVDEFIVLDNSISPTENYSRVGDLDHLNINLNSILKTKIDFKKIK